MASSREETADMSSRALPDLDGRGVICLKAELSYGSLIHCCFSPVIENFELLLINAELDVGLQSLNWYSRVPSKSNIGDSPLRLQFTNLEASGFTRCRPLYPSPRSSEKGMVAWEAKKCLHAIAKSSDSPIYWRTKSEINFKCVDVSCASVITSF